MINPIEQMYNFIDKQSNSLWIVVPLKFAFTYLAVSLVATIAEHLALKMWVRVTTRCKRRISFDDAVESARKIGVDLRHPNWRSRFPRSVSSLDSKSILTFFHYHRARSITQRPSHREFEKMARRRFLVWTATEIPLRVLRAAMRPSIYLVVAGYAVYLDYRPQQLHSDFNRALEGISTVGEHRTWVPLLVVLVGIGATVRSSPLIDRIRARDEAAKEANRLLTELLGQVSRLRSAVATCHDNISGHRSAAIEKACNWQHSGTTWSPNSGIGRPRHRLIPVDNSQDLEEAASAIKAAEAHLREIRDRGLSSVVFRMMSPVSTAFIDCGFHRPLMSYRGDTEGGISHLLSFEWLVERTKSSSRRVDALLRQGKQHQADLYLLRECHRVDDLILKAKMDELQLQRIYSFLVKRIHGTAFTRLVGSTAK